MPALTNTFDKYSNEYFIETGTGWDANGLLKAYNSGKFKYLLSCEGSLKYVENCQKVIGDNPRIKLYCGLSEIVLAEMIADINVPCTFWLDSHFAGGDQAKGAKNCPLMEELEIIRQHPIKTHTILIDDIRCCSSWLFDGITLLELIDKIHKINPSYKIEFKDCEYPQDILVAQV